MSIDNELIDQCRLEAKRCRKAVAKGSPRAFWVPRIRGWLQRIDEARTVLQILLEELQSPRPEAQDGDDGSGDGQGDKGGT